MSVCQNCGKTNTEESQFCRFCGHRIASRQPENFGFQAPRPYAWKTDEYQTHTDARENRVNIPAENHQHSPQMLASAPVAGPMAYRGPQDMSGNYRCPFCGTNYLPIMERRVSTAGWITFGLLLAFTIVFFWIGLLLKEEVPICPICRRQVG